MKLNFTAIERSQIRPRVIEYIDLNRRFVLFGFQGEQRNNRRNKRKVDERKIPVVMTISG